MNDLAPVSDDSASAFRSRGADPLRRPAWVKVRIGDPANFNFVDKLISGLNLHTVCQEARCPNIFECWRDQTATFMILGDICTRHCGFCAVTKNQPPRRVDPEEPRHVAEAVRHLGIKHAVVTSVNRDELPDGGAAHFAATIRSIRETSLDCAVEVLVPDFMGNWSALDTVMAARPEVLNHNTETVPRLYRRVRPVAGYDQTLELLRRAAAYKAVYPVRTKSGLMVGLGESTDELEATFRDLRGADVDVLTVGQYLAPSKQHLPVEKFYTPEEFAALRASALEMGFLHVEAGPVVRSSYHARNHVANL